MFKFSSLRDAFYKKHPKSHERVAEKVRKLRDEERLREGSPLETIWPTLEAFYADEKRRHSPEIDYGVWWTYPEERWPVRVSLVVNTGEIYAVRQGGPRSGEVEVLTTVSGETEEQRRAQAEKLLDGWPEACGTDGIGWIRQKIAHADNENTISRVRDTVYLYSNREGYFEWELDENGKFRFDGEVHDRLRYALYEVEFWVEFDIKTGDFKILEAKCDGQTLVPHDP